ncbi:succinyl-diaminopimelate desuccinylase [Buchnera aphidicola (Chaitoregma tattakana)]|uniref:succinyl-diaminopimelate desuccinylase n=1 Tax=Buchnera aphidicola TaxID=9 RepID=UPI0031B82A7D
MSFFILKLLKKLVYAPSISPDDMGCQKIISNELCKIGFSIVNFDIQDTKNMWAEIGNRQGKTINFLGHTDVVPPGDLSKWKFNPFVPTIYKNNIFGRGVVDMKGAISAFIASVKEFLYEYRNSMNGRITILLTSDEEGSAKNGIKKVVNKLIKKKEKIDYCIVGEPTSIDVLGDTIKNGRRGSLHVYIYFIGTIRHIAYTKFSENLIHKACLFINDLTKFNWNENIKNADERTVVQVYKIFSDPVVENVISDSLFTKINFRFSYKTSIEFIKSSVIMLLKLHDIKYSINWKLSGNSFITKDGNLLQAVKDTIKFFNRKEPKVCTSGGTSDGRFIHKMNSEIIELGLINKTIHKTNEFSKISDLKKLSIIYKETIKKLLT